MRRLLPLLFVPLAAVAAPAAADDPPAPREFLEVKDARRVSAVLTFEVTYPNLKAAEWVVFAPAAPELPGQADVKTTLDPAGTPAKDRSPLGRALVTARVPAKTAAEKTTRPVAVTYEATLRSRTLKPLLGGAKAPRVAPLTDAERKLYLADTADIDFAADEFKTWMADKALVRTRRESEITFARRAFLALRSATTYEYRPELDRRASAVCKSGKSDCGGMSVLFAAVMRANGVPARTLFGRWAQSARPDEKLGDTGYYMWHVKAEFFADGVGWVPVDLASGVLHDTSKEGLRFFGHDPGDFLTMHIDPGLKLDTGLFGVETVQNLQEPAVWVSGPGKLDGRTIKQGWRVTEAK